MSENPQVSIIIPTYNRAHLIGETLDSVLAQTYTNWECIIVDDGSSDNTDEVVGAYVKKDARFKYYHRPDEHLPGGNGARNYGFKMSQGEYVNWFDSDDLMLPEKIEVNLKFLLQNSSSLIIDEFKDFKTKKYCLNNIDIQNLKLQTIELKKYIHHKVFWGTVNFFSSKLLCNKISFNEKLKSGQEYNFFVKLILMNDLKEGIKINESLVLRRLHKDSIQQKQKKNPIKRHENKFFVYWETYNEVFDLLGKKEKYFFEKSFLGHYFELLRKRIMPIKPKILVCKTMKNKYQKNYLLLIMYFVFISRKGSLKLRNLYLKLIS